MQQGLRPDITLLLDVPVNVGLDRAQKRGAPDRFEREQRAFFERVRAAYLAAHAREPQRIRRIDASRPASDVTEAIIAALKDVVDG